MMTTEVDGQTRLAITVMEPPAADTVINGPGPNASGPKWDAHVEVLREAIVTHRPTYFVIAGRPPLDINAEELRETIAWAQQMGARVVLDLSSPMLELCLPLHPWLVKINLQEAQQATASQARGINLVRALLGLGAENAVVTNGPGSVAGVLAGRELQAEPPAVNTVSAVGCGDSFLAGLLTQLVADPELRRPAAAVRTAIAVASASALDQRPGFFDPTTVDSLQKAVEVRTAPPGE
ncbi:MAG: 1-phosphofructokinase [Actinomycetota bacterium]|jgi:fructose-1-phosphate kinase PfkB-like protein|nr:1-phosphofructokinase [Actinomycetota bacterium]